MSLEGILVRGRGRIESRMTDACTSRREAATGHDDNTGETIPTWTDLYSGPCRLVQPASGSNSASRTTVGESEVLLQQPELHLPVGAVVLRPGDQVTITASATDPALVGRVLYIRAVPGHSQATARRYGVTERTS